VKESEGQASAVAATAQGVVETANGHLAKILLAQGNIGHRLSRAMREAASSAASAPTIAIVCGWARGSTAAAP
jgi:hypothetical protein